MHSFSEFKHQGTWINLSALISVLLTLIMFSIVYFNLDKGFNFSDEGMYLYSIAHPQRPWSLLSDFGAFLYPIYEAAGYDLYTFRIWTFFALIISSKLLIISFLMLCQRHLKLPFTLCCATSFALWSCTLGYYTYWLPTASYNTLAVIGIFGVLSVLNFYSILCRPKISGHMLANENINKYCKITLLLFLALFGVLAFIGKTTTGAGMGILAGVWIFFTKGSRKTRLYDILISAVLALIILCFYLFAISDGTETIRKIILCAQLLDNSYSFGQTLAFYAQYIVPTSYVLVLFTWPLWAAVLWALYKENYRLALAMTAFTTLLALITSYIWIANYIMALVLWPLMVIVFVAACLWKISWQHVRLGLRLAIVFFMSGIIYHAGTNTPFEFKMSEALLLPALSVISLCVGMLPRCRVVILPGLAMILCCVTLGALFYSIFEPTRHNGRALWELTEPVVFKENTHPIYVHPERKLFINWIKDTAKEHGWQAGTPIINTSYYSSGSLFLLDGYKMEGNWQIQARYTPKENYPIIFSFAPAEQLKSAWIIRPVQDTPRSMPTSILSEIGLPFPEGYEKLSTSTLESVEGVWPAEQYEIWKPK